MAVVQARTGSARLPGKVLMDVAGLPLIAHTLRRLKPAEALDSIVLATSDLDRDDELAEVAAAEGATVVRGPEDDVLTRFVMAADETQADMVVRITGDCPLPDPAVVDRVVRELADRGQDADYASNVIRRTYPKGLDVEALWSEALRRIDQLATSPEAREHVTWFAYRERPDLFRLHSVEQDRDVSDQNWSVDTEADLDRVREFVSTLERPDEPVSWTRLADYAA